MKFRKIALCVGALALVAACERDQEVSEEPGLEEEVAAGEAEEQAQPGVEQKEMEQAQPGVEEKEVEQVAGKDQAKKQDAMDLANEAAATLKQMKGDPKLEKLLGQSAGVFIVPNYGRAGVGVGGRGGEGVLLANKNGKWSEPVFYDIGGISVGAQLGAEGGEIAMLFMNDQALNSFKGDDTFSLNAEADLTIVDYSGLTQTSLDENAGDVIFWSDTEGAFAGATLSATDISWDDEENAAYYGKTPAKPEMVLGGKVSGPKNTALEQALQGL